MTQYLPVLEMVTNGQLLTAKLKVQVWLLRLKLNQPCHKERPQTTEQPAPTSAAILCKVQAALQDSEVMWLPSG